jgi:hypothetical protein
MHAEPTLAFEIDKTEKRVFTVISGAIVHFTIERVRHGKWVPDEGFSLNVEKARQWVRLLHGFLAVAPQPEVDRTTSFEKLIARYQACTLKLLEMLPAGSIPSTDMAQGYCERLESIIRHDLLRPRNAFEPNHIKNQEERKDEPIPMRLVCPTCKKLHIDEGEFATKPHHTHACQFCGNVWRPALQPTVGVQFANVGKLPRDRTALRLKSDRVLVFAGPSEFAAHHRGITKS